jgi:hypothetical protein
MRDSNRWGIEQLKHGEKFELYLGSGDYAEVWRIHA